MLKMQATFLAIANSFMVMVTEVAYALLTQLLDSETEAPFFNLEGVEDLAFCRAYFLGDAKSINIQCELLHIQRGCGFGYGPLCRLVVKPKGCCSGEHVCSAFRLITQRNYSSGEGPTAGYYVTAFAFTCMLFRSLKPRSAP
jgi:hypothetical protein